ncbi:MAG: hypothetical protein ABJM29_06960 [Rhizobiaceae bacterium]
MCDSNSPSLTHIYVGEQGNEFPDEAFENGERRTLNGFGYNQNNPEFRAGDQPLIRITEDTFGYGVNTPRGAENGVQTLPNEIKISNAIADQDDHGDGVEDKTL